MKLSRTFDLIPYQIAHSPSKKAIHVRDGGDWKSYSSQALWEELCQYAGVLDAMGIQKGDFIMLLPRSATLPMLMLDLAAQHLGITVVLIHATSTKDQFSFAYKQVQPAAVFFQDARLADRYQAMVARPAYQLEGPNSDPFWQALKQAAPLSTDKLHSVGDDIKESDLSTIIYTSGTTGVPKGVMLSHANIMTNVTALAPLLPLDSQHKVLSFLPFSHIFERTAVYAYLCLGLNIYLVEGVEHLQADLLTLKPHLFTAVPRILERMYDRAFLEKAERNWVGRNLLGWALKEGIRYKEQKGIHPVLWVKMWLSRIFIWRKFRKALGGKLKAIIVGAAYMNPEIARSFAMAGIPVREGYGMTETSPVITVNRMKPGLNRYGTVGLPLPGVHVKIDAPDEEGVGEVWVKGPNVMQGYFQNPQATQQVIDAEGWLKTGDMGRFVGKRFLQITDRKKDLFKTSSGKYIAPQVLEAHFRQSHFIDQLLLIGFQRPFLTALILPLFSALEQWAETEGVHWTSPPYMVLNIKVKAKVQEEVDRLNKVLPGYQRIQAFQLVHEPWTVESGYISNTLKPIRNRILEAYQKEIEELYKRDS